MEIIPGVGVGTVRFGIKDSEAMSLLGNPDKAYTTDEGCKRLQFQFGRLDCINVGVLYDEDESPVWPSS